MQTRRKRKLENSLVPPAGRTLDHSLVLQAASINVCSANGTKYAETEWDARGEERMESDMEKCCIMVGTIMG